jgi:hypothetical protein
MNQTGVFSAKSHYRTERHQSVRLGSKNKRRGLEFKILQMNLQFPPTTEKSNIMTCELDLTHLRAGRHVQLT